MNLENVNEVDFSRNPNIDFFFATNSIYLSFVNKKKEISSHYFFQTKTKNFPYVKKLE